MYLKLLESVRAGAENDGIMTARTSAQRQAGEAVLLQVGDAIVRIQGCPLPSHYALLSPPTLPQLAMLTRMAQNVASWLLGGPSDSHLALPSLLLKSQLNFLPSECRMHHQIAAAAGV